MKYLLDTNVLSELVRKQPKPQIITRLAAQSAKSLVTSCVRVMELRFGSALRKDFEAFWSRILGEILSRVDILPLGAEEALIAGDTLAHLQKTGRPIGIEPLFARSARTLRKNWVGENSFVSRTETFLHNEWVCITAATTAGNEGKVVKQRSPRKARSSSRASLRRPSNPASHLPLA